MSTARLVDVEDGDNLSPDESGFLPEKGVLLDVEADEARQIMAAVVAEKGADYVYPTDEPAGCLYGTYRDGEGPFRASAVVSPPVPTGCGCIVGAFLVRAGLPLADLAQIEGRSASGAIRADTVIGQTVVRALQEAQSAQDGGSDWGSARGEFEHHLNEWGGA